MRSQVNIRTHVPASQDNRRVTARSKGKVERAFRSIKEAHEVLYHLREPKNELEANDRLFEYLKTYNDHQHRQEPHSRMRDWELSLPSTGIREMCSWERFCTFAREPENRKVGVDARILVDGVSYEVDPDLAGERVILWWGLFDNELFVENSNQRFGPYIPIDGPVPINRYRKFKKTKNERKLDKLEAIAKSLVLCKQERYPELSNTSSNEERVLPRQPFIDPDPFHEINYDNAHKARLAIANYLGKPLALVEKEQLDWINELLTRTLEKKVVLQEIKDYFKPYQRGKHVT